VIPTIISQALSGAESIELGALHPVRDLNYVKDTAAGFLAVARSDEATGTVTNIGRGEGISIGELATLILELCDSSAELRSGNERERPEKSEVQRLVCDNTKARSTLDWSPRYELREGLAETVEWMRENLQHYKPKLYNV